MQFSCVSREKDKSAESITQKTTSNVGALNEQMIVFKDGRKSGD